MGGVLTSDATKPSSSPFKVKTGNPTYTLSGVINLTYQPSSIELTFTDSTVYDIPASAVGTAITNIDVAPDVSGGTIPYKFSAKGLPEGITISKTGVISGTPAMVTNAGTATINVTDSATPPAEKSITIAYGAVSGKNVTADFTDPNFLAAVRTELGKGVSDPIYDTEVASVKYLSVSGKNISNLAGIEYFTNLTVLDCSSNQLTALPTALPSSLTVLICYNSQLKALPTMLPSGLAQLICYNNQLKELPTILPSGLTRISCQDNQLTELPALPSGLTELSCNTNQLTELPALPSSLIELRCNGNKLTALPTALPSSLTLLYCFNNQLTALPTLPSDLTMLYCDNNQLTKLDLSTLYSLKDCQASNQTVSLILTESGNEYTKTIELNNPTNLTSGLSYVGGVLTSDATKPSSSPFTVETGNDAYTLSGVLNLTYSTELTFTDRMYDIPSSAVGTAITNIDVAPDVSGGTIQYKFSAKGLPEGITISKTGVISGTPAMVTNAGTATITVTDSATPPAEKSITIAYGAVSGKNVTADFTDPNFLAAVRTALGKGVSDPIYDTDVASVKELDVSEKDISDLAGIEYFSALTILDCSYNYLTTLDISSNTSLLTLNCYYNRLTTLDISSNTALEVLTCGSNRLTTLDISSNIDLHMLDCSDNYMPDENAIKGLDTNQPPQFTFNPQNTGTPPTALKVLGIYVNDSNKDSITGQGISGGVSYDPTTKTLTLNNAVITTSTYETTAIYTEDDLTVELVGQNQIGTAPSNPANKADYSVGTGIYSEESLSLTGEGSLTVYDANEGIVGSNNLTIDIGGSLIVMEYGAAGQVCCLKTEGVLTIERGSLNLTSLVSKGLLGSSIVINGGVITVQTQGASGHFAFYKEPSFGGAYAHRVFAGENADSATEVPSPVAANFTASKYVRIQLEGTQIYTISFNTNGGNALSPGTLTTGPDGKLSVLSIPTRSGSYRFDGWYTAASGGTQVTTSTVFSVNTTIYAHWTYTGSDDNGGGSSSGGSTTTPPATTPPATPAPSIIGSTATTTVTSTTGTDGMAAASVPAAQVDNALKQAQDAAAKSGEAPKIEIKVEATANAAAVKTAVPRAVMTAIASGNLQDMTISSPVANLTFDGAALNTIAGAAGDVSFSASKVDKANLPASVQTLIGNRPVYEFSVTSGGNTISQFGGNVSVAVPYQLGAEEDPNAIIISFINASGNLEIVTNGRYDTATGTVVFTTNHFSKYAIGYKKINFTDVDDSAWYAGAVTFLAARDITSGTTATTFSPDATLTRGQFITLLMRAFDMAADKSTANNFSDAGNTYYTGYLAAAKRLGITSGVGDNKFAPEQAITRQEMFTMLYNALKSLDKLPTKRQDPGGLYGQRQCG